MSSSDISPTKPMAKKTKAAAVEAPAAPDNDKAAAAAEKARKAATDVFRRTLGGDKKPVQLEPGKRIAPQAQCILNAIEAGDTGKGITRADLEKALTGVLVTRQPVGRIVSYYQKDLQSAGLITYGQPAAQ